MNDRDSTGSVREMAHKKDRQKIEDQKYLEWWAKSTDPNWINDYLFTHKAKQKKEME